MDYMMTVMILMKIYSALSVASMIALMETGYVVTFVTVGIVYLVLENISDVDWVCSSCESC